MSIPPYKPSPLEQHLNEIVSQRNNAERARVFDYVQTAYPHLKDVYESLATRQSLYTKPTLFVKTMHGLLIRLSGRTSLLSPFSNAEKIREHIVEILSCSYKFDKKAYAVKCPINEHAFSDEQNIAECATTEEVVLGEELNLIHDLLEDFLEMTGQLARRINSCEQQRILRTIVAVRGKPRFGACLPSEAAARLADEIIYCFNAVQCEIRLLTPAERAKLVYPKRPRRRPFIVVDANPPPHLPPEEKTKFCRDLACKRFKEENFHLLPFHDFKFEEFDAVKQTEKSVTGLAESYKAGDPTLDRGDATLDYSTLGQVLSADFALYYDHYFMVEDYDPDVQGNIEYEEHDDVIEATEQQKAKERIISHLRGIMEDAIKLSAACGSKASEDWTAAQVVFEKRDGNFHSYSAEDEDATESELQEFLTAFRHGRQRLWADWQRHRRKDVSEKPIPTEPQGKTIEDIKESMRSIDANTAQAALNTTPKSEPRDRVIALVRRVNKKIFKGKSIPKAVNYVRFEDKVEDELVELVEEARQFATSFSNSPSSKTKDEDSFWSGIAKSAQTSAASGAAKRKLKKNADPSAPPGPVPIIDGDTGGGLY